MNHVVDFTTPYRRRLPNRRAGETVNFTFHSFTYSLCVGYFNTGEIGEIFISCPPTSNIKVDSQAAQDARDIAILISLAIQHGCPIETMRDAITRDADGTAAGVAGAALDILKEKW